MAGRRAIVLLGLMGGLFLAAMDATVLALAMPAVAEDLQGHHLYAWAFTSYMLAAAVSMPVLGALSDRYGRTRFFVLTMGLFMVGSLACGLSPTMEVFVASRVLQGIGGGGMLSIPYALAGALFTGPERGRALGRLASVWGVAAVAGPLLGAAAVALLSWHWVFYVNLPVGALGAWAVVRHHRDETLRADGRVDVLGGMLLMGSVALLLLALEPGMSARAWLGAVGAVLLALFFVVEARSPSPLLPMRLLARRPILSANVAALLAALAAFVPIAFVPPFVEQAFGEGRGIFAVLPLSVGWSASGIFVGPRIHRWGKRPVALAGLAMLATGLLGAPILLRQGLWGVAFDSALVGIGMGFATPALLLMVQDAAPLQEMGAATASQTFLRNVGGAIGVVALGALIPTGEDLALPGLLRGLVPAGFVALAGMVVALAGADR